MEMALWVGLGSALGWIGYAYVGLSARWGMVVSIILGAAGSIFGGEVLGPLIGPAVAHSGDFNPLSLLVALAGAAAFLVVGNMVYNRIAA